MGTEKRRTSLARLDELLAVRQQQGYLTADDVAVIQDIFDAIISERDALAEDEQAAYNAARESLSALDVETLANVLRDVDGLGMRRNAEEWARFILARAEAGAENRQGGWALLPPAEGAAEYARLTEPDAGEGTALSKEEVLTEIANRPKASLVPPSDWLYDGPPLVTPDTTEATLRAGRSRWTLDDWRAEAERQGVTWWDDSWTKADFRAALQQPAAQPAEECNCGIVNLYRTIERARSAGFDHAQNCAALQQPAVAEPDAGEGTEDPHWRSPEYHDWHRNRGIQYTGYCCVCAPTPDTTEATLRAQWRWECPSCDESVSPMGMCETCGVFGVQRLVMDERPDPNLQQPAVQPEGGPE